MTAGTTALHTSISRRIRFDPTKNMGSVYDTICLVTGCLSRHAKRHLDHIASTLERCGLVQDIQLHQFPGPGQRLTPVAPVHTLVTIIMLLPSGVTASKWKVNAAEVMCRAFGGDAALCREVLAVRPESVESLLTPPSPTALPDMDFEVVARDPDLESGYVYMCGSPLLDGIKVGTWRGAFVGLTRRYRTYYGPNVWVAAWWSPRCRTSELALFAALGSRWGLGGELFRKDAVPRVEAWLDATHTRCCASGYRTEKQKMEFQDTTAPALEAALAAHPRGHEVRAEDLHFFLLRDRRWTRGVVRDAIDALVSSPIMRGSPRPSAPGRLRHGL